MYDHEIFPDVKYHWEARNLKKVLTYLIWSLNHGSAKSINAQIACCLKMQLLDKIPSQNFAGLSILTSEIKSENFRSLSERLAILQNNL